MAYTTTEAPEFRVLLACAQAGDERAFRELIEPYRRALLVHAYRMLGSRDDAEDVTQEALLRAWRALDRFEPRASLRTWLYRIATNVCLDEIERRPRRPEPVNGEDAVRRSRHWTPAARPGHGPARHPAHAHRLPPALPDPRHHRGAPG